MKNTRRHWAGVDWADKRHAVCVVDEGGEVALSFSIPHTEEGLDEMVARLKGLPDVVGVAVETRRHLLVQKLLETGFTVYPINPKLSHAWRRGESVSEAKSDPVDAWILADGLRQRHVRLRSLALDDSRTRALALLCADENRLIAERTAIVNRLRATLKEYYPTALRWFSVWTSPSAWDFILTFPTPEALRQASKKRLMGFLKTHQIGLTPLWTKRVDELSNPTWQGDPATVDAKSLMAVSLAKQLRTLEANLDEYRRRIEELFAEHPDSDIFSSLPGAGPKLAPRLLSHFGSQTRDQHKSAQSLQQLSGVVTVTEKSGNLCVHHLRRACQKDFRNTMHQFAQQSIGRSLWANAFYNEAKGKGQSHALAVRNLGAKWIKIIYRMWQEHETYDEQLYIASLVSRNSSLVPLLKRM